MGSHRRRSRRGLWLELVPISVFDMGYFDTVGLRFADIPTTISDHVRSALLWVPQAVAAAVAYGGLVLVQWKVADVLSLRAPSPDGDTPCPTSAVRHWINRGLIISAFLIFWADLLTGGLMGKYAAASSAIVITYIVIDGISRSPLVRRLSPARLTALCALPIFAVLVYNTGVSRAVEEQDEPRKATITLEGPKELTFTVYRYLDRGVLAGDGQGKLIFYRWEDIKRLSATFKPPERTNWLCKAIDFTCPRVAPAPATPASGRRP